MDIRGGQSRSLTNRLIRAIAFSGFCYSLLFLINQFVFMGFAGFVMTNPSTDFNDILASSVWLSFLLLLVSSTALYFFKAWGRIGFIIAASILMVCVTCSELHELKLLWQRPVVKTQPPGSFQRWQEAWAYLNNMLIAIIPLGLGIWALRQREIIEAITPTETRGFAVLPIARSVEDGSSQSLGDQ